MKILLVRWHDRHIEASCICNDDEVSDVYKKAVEQLQDSDLSVIILNPTSAKEFEKEIESIIGISE